MSAKAEETHRKRERVQRACDDCRHRKTRCDGKLPCSACVTHLYDCSYDRPNSSRRIYRKDVEELERKVDRLTTLLRTALPEADIEHLVAETRMSDEASAFTKLDLPAVEDKAYVSEGVKVQEHASISANQDVLLETMVEAKEHVRIDGSGNCDYQGDFSGLILLRRLRERCGQLLDSDIGAGDPSMPLPLSRPATPPSSLPRMSEYIQSILPSKTVASDLVFVAFDCAFPLMRFVHWPTFEHHFDMLYAAKLTQAGELNMQERRWLALLFEVLALGQLFSAQQVEAGPLSSDLQAQANVYFRTGRDLINITDCQDLTSLQALVCMIYYLQSKGMVSSCYTHICLAVATSVKMGLHRSATSQCFNCIDRETRKRTFWVLRTMDTYITTLLGLPKTLCDKDIDQELPIEVDDEFVTEHGVQPMPCGQTPFMAAVNAHTELLQIMAKVVKYVHSEDKARCERNGMYRVLYTRMVEVEADLDSWFAKLVQPTSFQEPISSQFTNMVQLLLRLAYAHVQMVLYRPFLHHLLKRKSGTEFSLKSFACASACIKAAMQAVWLGEALDARGWLAASHWFSVHTTFFAIICLMMFVLSNANDPTAHGALAAAQRGLVKLKKLSGSSSNAARCVTCLMPLFTDLLSTRPLWSAPQPPEATVQPSQIFSAPFMEQDEAMFSTSTFDMLSSYEPEAGLAANQQKDLQAMAYTPLEDVPSSIDTDGLTQGYGLDVFGSI